MAAGRRKGKQDLRATLLAEAIRLIAARGFEAIALQDVASAASTTKQALLYHFESREALRDAVLDSLLKYANQGLIELMGTLASDGRGRIEQVLSMVEMLFEKEPHAAAALLRLLLDGDEHARQRIEEGTRPWLGFMVDLIQRGQEDGTVRKGLDAEAAVAQVGLLVVANFAVLEIHGWTDSPRAEWRKRRLAALVNAIRNILFVDAARAPRQG
jgi:AcrR family transcriptional regulator